MKAEPASGARAAASTGEGRTECSWGEALAFHARRHPDEPALLSDEEALSWRELDASATRLARCYLESGVAHGDMIAIGLPNGAACVIAVAACWKAGAVPLVLPAQLTAAEASELLARAAPRLVVGEPPCATALATLPQPLAQSRAHSEAPLPETVSPFCRATCSGGSTGLPKIVVDHTEARCDPEAGIYTVKPRSVTLVPGPLYHSGPFLNCFWTLLGGGRVILMRRFDAETALRLIDRHRPGYVGLVPTMMLRIWRLPEELKRACDLSSLERVVSSGAACPEWLMRAWIGWLGPERMFEAYGASERVGGTLISGTEWLAHPGSVGRATLGRGIRITDRDGRELPAGATGQIWLHAGAETSFHYLGAEPERDAEGWVTLGDIGFLDADGYLYVTDRETDMIVSGGANIYPAEIEAAAEAHPLVRCCVVIGMPDEDLGQRVHAIVQCAGALGAEELRAFLAERLSRGKLPRSFEFVRDELRNDAGKVRRGALRAARIA